MEVCDGQSPTPSPTTRVDQSTTCPDTTTVGSIPSVTVRVGSMTSRGCGLGLGGTSVLKWSSSPIVQRDLSSPLP